ncbi:MAG: hypothetical protein M2R45_05026 [Verrucomicrobia subdivision 3 bacterium]|nr:hypothetical protein [Limisphaerales bacterium]MCS1417647.1 hypothetical protein [Limisphaerales bacterium]
MGSIIWKAYPGQISPTEEQAQALRKRLVNEIPPEGFLKIGGYDLFAYHPGHEKALESGDPLLIH